MFIPLYPDASYQWSLLVLTAIGTLSYFFIRKLEYKDMYWIAITPFFILGYFIVFYQMTILELSGYSISKLYYLFVWADKTIINRSLSVATLGLLSFYLGTIFVNNSTKNEKNFGRNKTFATNSVAFLLILAYVFYVLFFLSAGSYSSGVYASEDASGSAVYFYKLFDTSLNGAIILKVSYITSFKTKELPLKVYISYLGKPLLLLWGWHFFFSLYLGDRGPLITLSLVTFGVYFLRWQKINMVYLIISLYIVSTIMTIIGESRQAASDSGKGYIERITETLDEDGEKKVSKRFDTYVPFDKTLELATSINTLNYVLMNVPSKYDYRYGLFQLQYIYGIIPGLAGRMTTLLYGSDTKYMNSSMFVTYLIQGNHPGYGNGTSLVADFYLDFGIIGVIVGLFLFGYFIRKNEPRLFSGYQYPTFTWIATLIFFSNALYLNRSSIGQELAVIAMIYMLIRTNVYIVAHFKKKKKSVFNNSRVEKQR